MTWVTVDTRNDFVNSTPTQSKIHRSPYRREFSTGLLSSARRSASSTSTRISRALSSASLFWPVFLNLSVVWLGRSHDDTARDDCPDVGGGRGRLLRNTLHKFDLPPLYVRLNGTNYGHTELCEVHGLHKRGILPKRVVSIHVIAPDTSLTNSSGVYSISLFTTGSHTSGGPIPGVRSSPFGSDPCWSMSSGHSPVVVTRLRAECYVKGWCSIGVNLGSIGRYFSRGGCDAGFVRVLNRRPSAGHVKITLF